ncbi:hypothetical protein [Desulfurobacterium sp.]
MKFKKLFKCSHCGNAGEFEYIGSRNINKTGEVKEIVGNKELWVSYYRCPNCNIIDIEMHPAGEKPDIPGEFFKEVLIDEKSKEKITTNR